MAKLANYFSEQNAKIIMQW